MRILIVLTVVGFATVYCQTQATGSLTDLISSVFSNNNGNNADPGSTTNVGTGGDSNAVDATPRVTGCAAGQTCIRHFLCKDSKLNKGGEGVIDIRFDDDHPQDCPHYLETCCSTDDTTDTSVIDVKPAPEGCGFRNVDGIGFKITGDKDNETQYGEFPWMVAILKEEKAGDQTLNIYQCGGSLIHPKVVLTAAHCVQNKAADTLKIRAGEWDTQTKTELFPHQDRGVAEVAVHEHYNKGSLYNDIALLFLQSPVDIEENVRTVCLPPADAQFDFERCIATGWGKDVFGQSGKYQVILKKIDLPIVPRKDCQTKLRSTRLGQYFELHRSFICAGGEIGKDTCKGDGGSPLVCPIAGSTEQFVQAGIVAWGIGCGGDAPGVYASVAQMRPWLDEQLAYRNIESSFYTP